MSDNTQSSNNNPIVNTPMSNPDDYKHFAFVVDGDVGHISRLQIGPVLEGSIACLSSNPTVVEITGDLRTQVNLKGWKYDGNNFIPPSE